MVNQITHAVVEHGKELMPKNETTKKTVKSGDAPAVLELSPKTKDSSIYGKPDIEKIRQMQAENEKKMLLRMLGTSSDTFLKQAGGLKNILEQVLSGKKVEGFDLQITSEMVEEAKTDVAEGGYWSAESTAGRLVEFAKALSGNDAKQADKLIAAIKEGFEQAQGLWGDKLPQISQDTLKLTMEKMEAWKASLYAKAE